MFIDIRFLVIFILIITKGEIVVIEL